ncbi:MAG TPA: hypothetical protein VL099_12865 [Candidatus Binatia bacterium]|nr:hypothetical protein [Candidatus Binatia bacterium]
MDSLHLSQWLGDLSTLALVGVCTLALKRRLWGLMPWFTTYLLLVLGADGLRWLVLQTSGFRSAGYSWTWWMTQTLLVAARGAALVDLCRAALSQYTGVWQAARLLLFGSACTLLLAAALRTAGKAGITSYLVFVERELELAIVVVVVLLLIVSRYYGVELERPLGGIAFGLIFYSSIVVITSSILIEPLDVSWPVFSLARTLAYLVAEGAWAYAMRLPFTERARPPLTTAAEFELASGAVDQRMRELNARILQILKR